MMVTQIHYYPPLFTSAWTLPSSRCKSISPASSLALPNTSAGHRSLLTRLRRLQARTGCPAHVVCEGTGG